MAESRRPPLSIGIVVAIVIALVVAWRNQQTATSPPTIVPTDTAITTDPTALPDERRDPPAARRSESRPADPPRPPARSEPERVRKPEPPASAAARTREPNAVAEIRIGSWNIEWLGKPDDRSGQGRGVAQTPTDLADYIAAAKVSVLALQEIVPDGGGDEPQSDELEAALAEVGTKAGGTWQYMLFPGRGSTDQLCGVAWNEHVVRPVPIDDDDPDVLRMRLPIAGGRSAQGSTLWHRPPHIVKFRLANDKAEESTDFALIVVHMKADYEGDFAQHRGEEASRLTAQLPQVMQSMSEQDVVIIGDTNMTSLREPAAMRFEAAGVIDLNTKGEATHWRGGASDRIFVPARQPEFAACSFEVMSDRYLEPKRWEPRDFKRRLSDHYLVVTTIKVMPDDD